MNAAVKAVPEGYDSVTPYLIVRGAAKAISFYEKAFAADLLARRIAYFLPMLGRVRVSVFDVKGREVARPLDEERPAGWGSVRWDLRGAAGALVPPGLYFVNVATQGRSATKRVVVTP